MKKLLIAAAGVAVACGMASGAQMIRYVSVDGTNNPPYTNWADAATSIAVAVTAANLNNSGDIVWISNGPHQVSATINIGNTKVRGVTGDYRDVIVDGGGNSMTYAAFRLMDGDAELSAVTVSNCTGGNLGAGVCLYTGTSSEPAGMVSNCLITSCTAGKGAAIYYACYDSIVANCVILGNSSTAGSPFHTDASAGRGPIIHDTLICSNINTHATTAGGGIYINTPNAYLRDTTFSGNTAGNGGGAICGRYDALFERCLIVGNSSQSSGGGGGVSYQMTSVTRPVFSNCTVVGNTATSGSGGGMYLKAAATLYNCLIASNYTTLYGGGLYLSRFTSEVHNCTIVNNTSWLNSSSSAGGVHSAADSGFGRGILVNTIVYSNRIYSATSVYSNYLTYQGEIFTNCCTVPMPTNGANNIADTPGLRDMAAGQYEPVAGSKCIDAGLNEGWMAGSVDPNGRPRLDRFTRQADIGAYEYVYPGSLLSVR